MESSNELFEHLCEMANINYLNETTGQPYTSLELMIEAANETDLVKKKGYLQMMASGIRDNLRQLVPSKAIRDLKIVNEHITNTLLLLIPYAGPFIVLFKTLFRMKNLDPREAKEALTEAEKFSKNLERGMREATKKGDAKLARKLEAQWREVESMIGSYKHTYKHVIARGVKSGI